MITHNDINWHNGLHTHTISDTRGNTHYTVTQDVTYYTIQWHKRLHTTLHSDTRGYILHYTVTQDVTYYTIQWHKRLHTTLHSDTRGNSPKPQRAALCRAVSPTSLVILTLHIADPVVWNNSALTHYGRSEWCDNINASNLLVHSYHSNNY